MIVVGPEFKRYPVRSSNAPSLRGRLVALALLVAMPLLAFAAAVLLQLASTQRRLEEERIAEAARAIARTVDGELARAQSLLEGLATSPYVDARDFRRLHAQARRLAPGDDRWIVLFSPDGDQLLNTFEEWRADLPKDGQAPAVEEALQTGLPSVTDVVAGSAAGEPVVGTGVPVYRNGEIAFVLSLSFRAAGFSELLASQVLPQGWSASLLDRAGVYVARSDGAARYVGRPASEDVKSAMASGAATAAPAELEGSPELVAVAPSFVSDWTVLVRAPIAAINAPVRRSLWLLGAGGLALVALSVVLASFAARRIARPMERLAGDALALGRGETVDPPESSVAEVDAIGRALADASALLREHQAELEARTAQLETVLSTAPIAIWFADEPDARRRTGNRRAAELVGFEIGQAASYSATADELPAGARVRQHGCVVPFDQLPLARAGRGEEVGNEELEIELQGRPTRTILANAAPIRDPYGRIIGAVAAALDITDRKRWELELRESEEKLREAQEIAGLGRWEYDAATQRISWSDEVFRIFGRDRALGEPSFAELQRMIHAGDRKRFVQLVQTALEDGVGFETEWRALRPDGSYRWKRTQARVFRDEQGRTTRLVGTDIDVTARKEAETRQRFLMAELDHRVKNTLATVQSIAAQTLGQSPLAESLFGRITALAKAHAILSGESWRGADLGQLLDGVLSAHQTAPGRVGVRGPKVMLGPKLAQSLALALHELGTNAAKYGALSVAGGKVEVCWRLVDDGAAVQIVWTETGGPQVARPERRGFGSALIERSLAYEFGAKVRMQFEPEGVRCTIDLPLGPDAVARRRGAETPPQG